jgi:D-alanyl-D-alanine carboxypeptidase
MTCWVSLQLAYTFKLNLEKTYFYISNEVDFIEGTSAKLEPNYKISLLDLLYGLMLPSGKEFQKYSLGNDAAIVLAENFSHLVKENRLPNDGRQIQGRVTLFVNEMNKSAKELQMNNTLFFNPHGF